MMEQDPKGRLSLATIQAQKREEGRGLLVVVTS